MDDTLMNEVRAAQGVAGVQCRTCVWLFTLPAKERGQWAGIMADRTLQHAAITRVMKAHGFAHGAGSVESHRKEGHSVGV